MQHNANLHDSVRQQRVYETEFFFLDSFLEFSVLLILDYVCSQLTENMS